ncbi:type II secretion system F family protein [Nocardiopsis chromatogenes]|uniref:type II secretion system F family protein n=1 Tax=Nocardiopsis chromatogenes TaxID=280239 RepID=UPI000345ADCB|nr:type II secretion system F family protein [Nocardiopsis chromatogenes]
MTFSTITQAAPVLSGALLGGGLAGIAYAAVPHTGRIRERLARLPKATMARRAVLAIAAGAGAALVTGWPVAGVLAAAGAWWLPRLLGPDAASAAEARRAEAVAAWAQQLRDLIAGSAGLHQAIAKSAPIAPQPVRAEVGQLAQRLRAGATVEEAVEAFSTKVDNPTADLVAIALATAEGRHAAELGELLGRLAEASRDRAALLARTSASRARTRSSVRIITAMALLMVTGLLVANRQYLEPFDTVTGQAVLAVVGATWAAGFAWMARLAAPVAAPRPMRPATVQAGGAG